MRLILRCRYWFCDEAIDPGGATVYLRCEIIYTLSAFVTVGGVIRYRITRLGYSFRRMTSDYWQLLCDEKKMEGFKRVRKDLVWIIEFPYHFVYAIQ